MAGLAFVGLALLTSQQARTWQHNRTVWQQAARVAPRSPRPLVNLAVAYLEAGELDLASRTLDDASAAADTQGSMERAWANDVIIANYAVIALRRGNSDLFQFLVAGAPSGSARAEACARVTWCQR